MRLPSALVCLDQHSRFAVSDRQRLPVHVNLVNHDPSISNPKDPISGWAGIPRNMTGMAALLKKGGYRTHMVRPNDPSPYLCGSSLFVMSSRVGRQVGECGSDVVRLEFVHLSSSLHHRIAAWPPLITRHAEGGLIRASGSFTT